MNFMKIPAMTTNILFQIFQILFQNIKKVYV